VATSLQASQWVIVHFASLIDYKEIKEIVQDALAMSRQLQAKTETWRSAAESDRRTAA
jgi:hypothetical protein